MQEGTKKSLLVIFIILEAVFLLVPTTLLYLFGMGFLMLALFTPSIEFIPKILGIAVFFLLPGFGLYSLWYLVFEMQDEPPHIIPKKIWVGVAIGSVIAIIAALMMLLGYFQEQTNTRVFSENLLLMIVFGGGPLLMSASFLAILRPFKKI